LHGEILDHLGLRQISQDLVAAEPGHARPRVLRLVPPPPHPVEGTQAPSQWWIKLRDDGLVDREVPAAARRPQPLILQNRAERFASRVVELCQEPPGLAPISPALPAFQFDAYERPGSDRLQEGVVLCGLPFVPAQPAD